MDIKDKLVAVPTTSSREVKFRVRVGPPCYISFMFVGKDRTDMKLWLSGDSIRGQHDLSKVYIKGNVNDYLKLHEQLRVEFLIRAVRLLSKAAAVNAYVSAAALNNAFEAAKADIKYARRVYESGDEPEVELVEVAPQPAAQPPAATADADADAAAALVGAAAAVVDYNDGGEDEYEDDDEDDDKSYSLGD
jgi:hypothetical protein